MGDSAGLAVFVKVEIIVAAGGASCRTYKKPIWYLKCKTIQAHTAPHTVGNWAMYDAFAVTEV